MCGDAKWFADRLQLGGCSHPFRRSPDAEGLRIGHRTPHPTRAEPQIAPQRLAFRRKGATVVAFLPGGLLDLGERDRRSSARAVDFLPRDPEMAGGPRSPRPCGPSR